MSGEQPIKQQSWCEHCLEILNDYDSSPIVEMYVEMREGLRRDHPCSHEEALEHIESVVRALRSSGERYFYEAELEEKALSEGLDEDELGEYEAIRARRGERELEDDQV